MLRLEKNRKRSKSLWTRKSLPAGDNSLRSPQEVLVLNILGPWLEGVVGTEDPPSRGIQEREEPGSNLDSRKVEGRA